MNKAVIFDLDGTLIDSIQDIKDGVNHTLTQFGKKEKDLNSVLKIIGNGARQLIKDAFNGTLSEEELNLALDIYNGYYDSGNYPKTTLFSGVDKMLETLKNRGYKLAILTNKPQKSTSIIYQKLFKNLPFDFVLGQTENVSKKPSPDGINLILQKLKTKKENAYYVGDGEADVLCALNAGVKCISALWGYRSKNFLLSFGAKVFANTPKDLLKFIK